MGSYVPNTLEERQEMLKEIGYSSIEDLFAHIPDEVKIKGGLRYSGRKVRAGSSAERWKNIASEESGISDHFPRCRSIQTFYSVHSEQCDFKRKFADSIYTVSGRDQSGNPTVHFRVSDNDL